MKKVFFTLLVTLGVLTFAKASESNSYTINDQSVEQLFTNSQEVSMVQLNQNLLTAQSSNVSLVENKMAHMKSDKSAALSIVLCFFVGGLGIHRAYLGTKTFTWVGYILTCGGIGGIVPFVDFFVLIFNAGNLDKYVDNSKFFMW